MCIGQCIDTLNHYFIKINDYFNKMEETLKNEDKNIVELEEIVIDSQYDSNKSINIKCKPETALSLKNDDYLWDILEIDEF